jgi:hypothetical protein
MPLVEQDQPGHHKKQQPEIDPCGQHAEDAGQQEQDRGDQVEQSQSPGETCFSTLLAVDPIHLSDFGDDPKKMSAAERPINRTRANSTF